MAQETGGPGQMAARAWPWLGLVGLALLAFAYAVPSVSASQRDWTYVAVTLSALAGAGAACFWRARRAGADRLAWSLLGWSFVAWLAGEAGWAWTAVVRGQAVAYPDWTDVAYLLNVPLAVAGLLALSWRRGTSRQAVAQVVDALLVAFSVLFVAWVLLLDRLAAAGEATRLAAAVTIAYPIGDVAMVAALVLAMARLEPASRRRLWPLMAGLGAMALADIGYTVVLLATGGYETSWFDLGWAAGAIGMGWAAWRAQEQTVRRGPATRMEQWLPATVVLLPLVVAVALVIGPGLDHAAQGLGVVLGAMVAARLALILTDQVRTTSQLREAQRLAGFGTWQEDRFGRLIPDAEAGRLLGIPPWEPAPFDRFVGGLASGSALLPPLQAARAGTGVELSVQTASTPPRHLLLRAGRLGAERLHGTVLDVTQSVVLDGERRRAEIQQAEAEKQAELARAKSAFINAAAHELNTPLTPIRLSLAAMKRSPDHAKIELVERNVGRLVHLLKDVLDGARLQANQLRLERGPVDLSALTKDTAEEHGPLADERGVALAWQGPPSAWVHGDAGRLHEVVMNLLGNALKFTPRGGRVDVRVKRQGINWRLEVQDTGRGVSAQDAAQLFQPFSQVGTNTGTGTGLGLYISKGLVEAHAGQIGLESAGEGQGALAWVVLPESSPDLPFAAPQ